MDSQQEPFTNDELASLLRRSLLGFRTSTEWWARAELRLPATWVAGTPRPPDLDGLYTVGRAGDRQWVGYGVPDVVPQMIVVGDTAYVRDSWALDAFDVPPGIDRLDRIVGKNWVRTAANKLARQIRTPEADLELFIGWIDEAAIAEAKVLAPLADGLVSVRCAGIDWKVDPVSGSCSATQLGELRHFVLRYGTPDELVEAPAEEVLDAIALEGPLGLRQAPRKPNATSADVFPPDDNETTWTVSHPELDELLHVTNCYEAQQLVIEHLGQADPPLLERLEFDSEGSLFAAYGESRKDALALRKHIDRLIANAKSGVK